MPKIRKAICNIAVDVRDICISLLKDFQSSGIILAKLKKEAFNGHVYIEAPCTQKVLDAVIYSPYKTVWRTLITLITSYYKESIDSLTK